jgi:hypothetical protein
MIERGREWGGPRYAAVVGEPTTWKRLGRHQRGPGGGRCGGRRGTGVDPTAVEATSNGRATQDGDCEMIPPGLGFKGWPCT